LSSAKAVCEVRRVCSWYLGGFPAPFTDRLIF
jgi:hypothetical protein